MSRPEQPPDYLAGLAYLPLLEAAEGIRWKLSDLPWDCFDPAKATPGLKAVVREMAFHEQATFSATQRFMQAFGDDLDFSQWVSIWFYEETRHPLALLRWLQLAQETVDPAFVIRGRVSAPFMRSRMGTLVTNVISELTAAQAYLALAGAAPEPLLGKLSQRIAADEARHAASFFSYARTRFERSTERERDRLDALKVLHFWLNESQSVTHPVNQTMQKLQALEQDSAVRLDWPSLRTRICAVVGLLVELELPRVEDVGPLLARFTSELHRAG